MWEYVLGDATIFGLIVALGTWFNGRVIRKIMIQYFERLDKRFEEVLKRMDEGFDELVKQHRKVLFKS